MENLNKRVASVDGEVFKLPSEAQWEYACRAGTTTATYAGELGIVGQLFNEIAWCGGNSGKFYELEDVVDSSDWNDKQFQHVKAGTHPVKQKRANGWGLYDMLGNVYEWCHDRWHSYADGLQINPIGMHKDDGFRVIRGGSFIVVATLCRAGYRDRSPRDRLWRGHGFRLCRGQPAAEKQEGTSK